MQGAEGSGCSNRHGLTCWYLSNALLKRSSCKKPDNCCSLTADYLRAGVESDMCHNAALTGSTRDTYVQQQ